MALGEQLRNAREEKNLTASEVAAATRMMVQIVEELEREDFHRFAAPIYGKGFIKLYAEFVGLDPRPLIDEYLARFAKPKVPSLKSEGSPPAAAVGSPDVSEEEGVAEQPVAPRADAIPEAEPEEPASEPTSLFGSTPAAAEEQEPDLFSRVEREARPEPPVEPPREPEPAPAARTEVPPVQSSQQLLDDAPPPLDKEPERPLWDGPGGPRDRFGELRAPQRWRSPVSAGRGLRFTSASSRLVLALAGILIVLVVMIGLMKQCSGRAGAPTVAGPVDDRPTELRLVEDPPEPYFGID